MTCCSKWRHSTGRRWSGVCVCVCVCVRVRVQWYPFVTPWTVAHQAPLSMRFSRQEYWSGVPFPSPGESSQPKDQTHICCISCIGRQILYHDLQWSDKLCDSVIHSLPEKLMKTHKQLLIREGYLFWSSLDLLPLLLFSGASHSWTSWFMLGSSLLPVVALLTLDDNSWMERVPRSSFSSQRKLCSLQMLCKGYSLCSFPPAISNTVLPPFSLNPSP